MFVNLIEEIFMFFEQKGPFNPLMDLPNEEKGCFHIFDSENSFLLIFEVNSSGEVKYYAFNPSIAQHHAVYTSDVLRAPQLLTDFGAIKQIADKMKRCTSVPLLKEEAQAMQHVFHQKNTEKFTFDDMLNPTREQFLTNLFKVQSSILGARIIPSIQDALIKKPARESCIFL